MSFRLFSLALKTTDVAIKIMHIQCVTFVHNFFQAVKKKKITSFFLCYLILAWHWNRTVHSKQVIFSGKRRAVLITHTQGFIILLLQNNFHLNRTSCYARGWMGRFLNERGIFGCSEYGGKGRRGKNFNATSRGSIVVFWKYCCSQMLPPFNALLFFLSKGQS